MSGDGNVVELGFGPTPRERALVPEPPAEFSDGWAFALHFDQRAPLEDLLYSRYVSDARENSPRTGG